MNKSKKVMAFMLSFVLLLSSSVTAIPVLAADAEDITGTQGYLGTTTDLYGNSKTGLTYESMFTENWEDGLDLNKWYVERFKEDYISDFQVVDDPLNDAIDPVTGKANQVIKANRYNTWLVPTDDYWPTDGLLAGEMTEIHFKLYLENFDEEMTEFANNVYSGFSYRLQRNDAVDGVQLVNWAMDGTKRIELLSANQYGQNGTVYAQNKWVRWYDLSTGKYTEGFDASQWMDITIYLNQKETTLVFSDVTGKQFSLTCQTPNDRGKFAIGKQLLERAFNKVIEDAIIYMDDIEIKFVKSDFDTDEVQKDVNVYYAGNTFLEPNETINVTGEKLGTTVLKAQLAKMTDEVVSSEANKAHYVNETTYDMAPEANVTWEELTDCIVETQEVEIMQRSESGLKMVIPNDGVYAERGSYALLLESAAGDEGEDEIVMINNPQISFLLHDDGDYATPNGWLKLSGYNLSVQNSVDKVNAIIIDADGNRTFVDQSMIEVDTTENNGVDNDYYMMVHLDSLEPGDYQIMVHNGFGGDYGWSMPYEFTVKAQAENEIWRDKGIFNVRNYGAVGDGETNDTAAIQNAINAAVANGGGMVYFPAQEGGEGASYRVTHPLIVGENISFVGDGIDRTILFYDGNFDIERQSYFIMFERNFELTGLELACQTNPFESIVVRNSKINKEPGKVYLHDVKLFNDYRGYISGTFGEIMPGYTESEVKQEILDLWDGIETNYIRDDLGETYFCMRNVPMDITDVETASRHGVDPEADYVHLTDIKLNTWSTLWVQKAAFVEDCALQNLANFTCFRNITNVQQTVNNRELFLRDGSGVKSNNIKMQSFINTPHTEKEAEEYLSIILEGELENLEAVKNYVMEHRDQGDVYRFLNYTPSAIGYIYITGGQGAGQIREITNIKKIGAYTYFTVEEKFAVSPNRNSEVSYVDKYYANMKSFVNNGEFHNGSLVGPYGSAFDRVFDNIKITKAESGVAFVCAYSGFMWYCTAKNVVATDISYLHTDYAEFGGPAGIIGKNVGSVSNIFLGIRYSNSFVGEGGKLQVNNMGNHRSVTVSDVVYEDIEIISKTPGLQYSSGSLATQGVWFRNIRQYTDANNKAYSEISPYESYSSLQSFIKTNGTNYIWADNINDSWVRQKGDVDRDGMITMNDLTLLRQFLGEQVTEEELNSVYSTNKTPAVTYADITNDGVVDARDFLYLRAYILELEEDMEAIGKTESGTTEPENPDNEKPDDEQPEIPEIPDVIIKQDEVILDFKEVEDED